MKLHGTVLLCCALLAFACTKERAAPAKTPTKMVLGRPPQELTDEGVERECNHPTDACEHLCTEHRRVDACLQLRRFYSDWRNDTKPDPKKELHQQSELYFAEKACEYGSGASCSIAGNMVHSGAGAPSNRRRELELRDRGCQLGEWSDCFAAAELIEYGPNASRDPQPVDLDKADLRKVDDYIARTDTLVPKEKGEIFWLVNMVCNITMPKRKGGCARYVAHALAALKQDTRLSDADREKERVRVLRASCDVLVERPDCATLPPMEYPKDESDSEGNP